MKPSHHPAHVARVPDVLQRIAADDEQICELARLDGSELCGDVRVVRSGELHDPAELLNSVKGRVGPASEADEARWRPQRTR